MATMLDVCKRAGVSKATVSRVLNNTGQVKESTREAVFRAMQELDYRPNSLAQALANQRSNTLGLVVSNFDGPYFGRLLKQAALSCELAGKQLIVTDGHDDPRRELQALDMLVDRCCDAIVLYSRHMPERELERLLRELPVPLVVMNRKVNGAPERCVLFQQEDAAQQVVAHLLGQGHRRIACITGGAINYPTAQARLQGYRQALQDAGLEADPALVAEGDFLVSGGYQQCKALLASGHPFTALFACNDDMAMGAYRALQEAGLRIPEDVSVFGFDDDPSAAFMNPPLSTVHLPVTAMTETAFTQALRLAAGEPLTPLPPFNGRLCLRDSVAPHWDIEATPQSASRRA